MHIGFRDSMQFIGQWREYNTLFLHDSNPEVLSSSWLFEMSHFDYMPYLALATISATPSHEFLSIYPQTWYIKYMYL
jgi:hypothetical protein